MTSTLRKAVFFVLLIGITYFAYVFMIKSANKHLTEQKARVQNKLQKLNEFQKASEATERLDQQLGELQQAITFFFRPLSLIWSTSGRSLSTISFFASDIFS